MEKITSISEFFEIANKDEALEEKFKNTRIYKKLENQWQAKCDVLKNAYKRNDIAELLKLEVYILTYEMNDLDSTDELKASAEEALKQYKDVEKCLQNAYSAEKYKTIDEGYSERTRDKQNLPKDACRQFINSQTTRLGNKLTMSKLSQGEIKYLSLRRDNMFHARDLYTELQKRALGLSTDKKKGLSL